MIKEIEPYWNELLKQKIDDNKKPLKTLKIKVKLLEAKTFTNGVCMLVIDSETKIQGYVLLFPSNPSHYYHSMIFHLYETFGKDIWLYGFLLSESKKVFAVNPLICHETLSFY